MSPCVILRRSRMRLMFSPNFFEILAILQYPQFSNYCVFILYGVIIPYMEFIGDIFLKSGEIPSPKSRPHSSPDPSCGRDRSRGKAENPNPQKNRFSLCRVRIEPRHLPEYLEGRTPKKNVLSFFRKNRARANPKSKRHFSLVSAEALRGGGGASSFALEVGSSKVYNYSTKSNFLKKC